MAGSIGLISIAAAIAGTVHAGDRATDDARGFTAVAQRILP